MAVRCLMQRMASPFHHRSTVYAVVTVSLFITVLRSNGLTSNAFSSPFYGPNPVPHCLFITVLRSRRKLFLPFHHRSTVPHSYDCAFSSPFYGQPLTYFWPFHHRSTVFLLAHKAFSSPFYGLSCLLRSLFITVLRSENWLSGRYLPCDEPINHPIW